MKPSPFRAAGLLAAGLIALGGCTSTPREEEARQPGGGIAEYREIAATAAKAVEGSLRALQGVAAQSNRCSPDALKALVDEVNRLQVDSTPLRARAEAILARGDGYFANWHETLAQVKEREVRALAERNRAELERRFAELKGSSQECRVIFKPFLAGCRELRNALEADPGALAAPTNQDLIAKSTERARQFLSQLTNIRQELDAMQVLITPAGTN